MSNGKNKGGDAITPAVLAFGVSMLVLGLALGYMLAPKVASNDAGPDKIQAETAPNKVVNNTKGELRKLDEREKRELTRKQKAPQAPQAPADSAYLSDTITKSFQDPLLLTKYRQIVGFMSRGNARAASSPLSDLADQSKGKAWREQVTALLAEAQAATSKTKEARATVASFKSEYPKSQFMATIILAEGRSWMQDGKRAAGLDGALSAAQKEHYEKALLLFDQTSSKWPSDDAAAEALFNRGALLGELGRIADAESTVYSLVERFPNYRNAPRSLSNLARAAATGNNSERAEAAYEKLIASFPKDRMAANARAQLTSLKLVGKSAPALDIGEWIGDNPGTLAELSGRPVMLVFWATWCPHCRREMPGIEETWLRYKDDGLAVVAVTKTGRRQTIEQVREYIGENGLTLPIAIDAGGSTSKAYAVTGIPAAALIDKNGNVVVRDHPTRITDEVIKKYL